MTLDTAAIKTRYQAALDAKPGKGPIDPGPLYDSVCDVPDLLAEIERLTQELSNLPQKPAQDATGGEKATRGGSSGDEGLKSAPAGSAVERLDEIRAREQAATEGPWEVNSETCGSEMGDYTVYGVAGVCDATWTGDDSPAFAYCEGMTQADAEFIAHARTDAPAMAAALTAVLDALDHYPVPSRQADPTGQILEALGGLERSIRSRITDALGGDRG